MAKKVMPRLLTRLLLILISLLLFSCRLAPGTGSLPTNSPLPTGTPLPTATDTVVPSPITVIEQAIEEPTLTATPEPTLTPVPTPTWEPAPVWPDGEIGAEDVARFAQNVFVDADEVGIQLHLHAEDQGLMINRLEDLNVGWVKLQVSWKTFEPRPGQYDADWFGELDSFIQLANEKEIKVLLSVAKAPEWSRPTTEMDGPPSDFAQFQRFMRDITARYQGEVDAYELWNEPNLRREWNGTALSPEAFVDLIAAGARGVREVDGGVILISGAPATTGINDGVNAIDDRLYFERMLAAGVGEHVDGIGVHPYGWANPADALMGEPVSGVTSHNDHPSFFFAHTVADYLNLMDRYRVDQPLWVTEFGWGSFETFERQPPAEALFMQQVSEAQQADYVVNALKIGVPQAKIGPMFLWNLNFAPLLGTQFSESGYSILRPDETERPVYDQLKTLLGGQ